LKEVCFITLHDADQLCLVVMMLICWSDFVLQNHGPWPRIIYWISGTFWTSRHPRSRVLVEKLIVTQLVKKFPTFYATQKSVTVITRSHRLSLSWARWTQSTPLHRISILILFLYLRLGLGNGFFPSGFPIKVYYAYIIYPMRVAYPISLFLLDLITPSNI